MRKAHAEHTGDILVFLPGQGEIRQCSEALEGSLGDTRICPLYGLLGPEQQRRAIAPSPPGRRKVVLATPIAETSITIEGVTVVVDSGLCRTLRYEPSTGLGRLCTVPISLDMATQRAGRAGRLRDGVCYRLWSKGAEARMAAGRRPEIMDADLAGTVLDIAAWGEPDASRLPWLTPPPPGTWPRRAASWPTSKHSTTRGASPNTGESSPFSPAIRAWPPCSSAPTLRS